MKILIDHREPEKIARLVSECHVEFEIKLLPAGDLWIVKDGELILVERKTIADFVASLRNNRLWEQLLRLSSCIEISGCKIKRCLLVLEGKFEEYVQDYYEDSKLWASIMGALLEVLFVYNTPVLLAENDEALKALFKILIKRELQGKNEQSPKARWYHREAVNLPVKDSRVIALAAIPLIGEVMARNLLAHFGSLEKIARASIEELQGVKGIGKARAAKIYEVFH
ncbi:MAG: helix-hairpin-helix domain-containing protein [Halobacteria archaeon]